MEGNGRDFGKEREAVRGCWGRARGRGREVRTLERAQSFCIMAARCALVDTCARVPSSPAQPVPATPLASRVPILRLSVVAPHVCVRMRQESGRHLPLPPLAPPPLWRHQARRSRRSAAPHPHTHPAAQPCPPTVLARTARPAPFSPQASASPTRPTHAPHAPTHQHVPFQAADPRPRRRRRRRSCCCCCRGCRVCRGAERVELREGGGG